MKQLSVFIENTAGSLNNVLKLIKESNIQLYSICVVDLPEYGLCRIICNDAQGAFHLMQNAGLASSLSDICAIRMEDKPGSASEIVAVLSNNKINIVYLYSFIFEGKPFLALRTEDQNKTEELLSNNNFKCLNL